MQAALITLFSALPVFGFVAFVIWLGAAQSRAKIRHRTELQKELIAKALLIVRTPEFLPGGPTVGALFTAVGVAFVINALLRVWITRKWRT